MKNNQLIKDVFLSDVVEFFEEKNEELKYDYLNDCIYKDVIDIPFWISVLHQNLCEEKYIEFLNDLKTFEYQLHFDFTRIGEDKNRLIVNFNEENYSYLIELEYEGRHLGYCQCAPLDNGYNEKYSCCGESCDWNAPKFTISKKSYIGTSSFNGTQKEYWKLEEQYYDKTLKDETKDLLDKINKVNREKEKLEEELLLLYSELESITLKTK